MDKNFILSCIIYLIYSFLISEESFYILKKNKYNDKNKYIKWLKKNKKSLIQNASISFIILILFIFIKKEILLIVVFNIIYLSLVINILNKKEKNKIPLKYDLKTKLLTLTNIILYIIPIILLSLIVKNKNLVYCYLLLGFISYINNLYILLALNINNKIEKLINIFKKKERRK